MSDEKKNNSMELSDEQLEQAAGGNGWPDAGYGTCSPQDRMCPDCHSGREPIWQGDKLVCLGCGHVYRRLPTGTEEFSPGDTDGDFLGGPN